MKKCLAFILALIVLTGSVYPCCLEHECEDDLQAITSHTGNSAEKGGCSPFFACATCPGFAYVTKPIIISKPFEQKIAHFETPVIFFTSTYSSSLFQPPRSAYRLA